MQISYLRGKLGLGGALPGARALKQIFSEGMKSAHMAFWHVWPHVHFTRERLGKLHVS